MLDLDLELSQASRLLSILYVLSPSQEMFMLEPTCTRLSASQWAAYFHQASVGTSLNHSFRSCVEKKSNIEASSSSTLSHCLSLPPRQMKSLETFILAFYRDLPKVTIACLNFVEDDFGILLGRLLPEAKADTEAWTLLSSLNSDSIPYSVIQPVRKTHSDNIPDSDVQPIREILIADEEDMNEGSDDQWECSWRDTIIFKVAPEFEAIFEELHGIMKTKPKVSDGRRRALDTRLESFLRSVQNDWLDPWANLLLGDRSSNMDLDDRLKIMKKDLKAICNLDIDERFLRVLLDCACGASTRFEFLAETILTRGCYTGALKMDEKCITSICDVVRDSCKGIGEVCSREPVILVLDYEAEALPWESIPALRGNEVYRMPSVLSIAAALRRCPYNDGEDLKSTNMFPVFNPRKSYYLLNVQGDLNFDISKRWFEELHIEGKVMTQPPEVELKSVLEKHDLFIYVSHGHGLTFIPGNIIQRLKKCPVAFLMGCSSGRLILNGSMAPIGAPLYYLRGGSPAIICNLWNLADYEVGAYSKDLIQSCIEHADERDADGRLRKKRKLNQPMNLGSLLIRCRDNCFLPYLTYGGRINMLWCPCIY